MSRLCIVVNNNKLIFWAALGGWCTILALGNLVAVFMIEEEIIYCLPFQGIYLAQISSQQR